MVYKKLHKHIAKHAKRVHAHVQDHGHKWLSILGIALIIILIYPYFSNAQTPETCTNGGVNFPTCDQCAEGYVLDESDQCVEDTQEPETCTNGAVNPSDCDECAEGYFLNGSQQCVEGILIPGCMDEGSMNYDPLATVDDGSCIPLTVETIQLTGTVQYSPATSTTGSVVATVTGFSTTGVTVTSAGGATHTFTGNGSHTFTFENTDGATGSAVATVTWIVPENTGSNQNPPTTQTGCTGGDITVNQPASGAIIGGVISLGRTTVSTCSGQTPITIQLRDHNGQWINIGTGTAGSTGTIFTSTGLASTGFYSITGIHLSGTTYGGVTYTQDTIYTLYTGAYTGVYTDFATGYMLRILDGSGTVLGQSNGTFTIDNRKPIISAFTGSFAPVISGSIGRPGIATFTLQSNEALSGASFTILGTLVSASTGSQSGNTYTYTVPLTTVANPGALVYTAHLSDLAGNVTNIYGTSAIVFNNHIPAITNFSLTGNTGSIGLGWKTDVNTVYTLAYNKSGVTTPTSYTSTVYGTMHNYTMTNIQNNNTYLFTLAARDILGNEKSMSGAIAVSTTGALQLTIYQDNGNTFQLSQQVELELYNQILQKEIDKFKACKESITINKETIKIGNKNIEIEVPVLQKNSVKNIVQAFLLFFVNKTKNTTLTQAELDEVALRMNNFFLIVKLLRDDDGVCQQNMSNYYIAQFEQIMAQARDE